MGYEKGFNDIIILEYLKELKFMAVYTKGNDLTAGASMNYNPIASTMATVLAFVTLPKSRTWSLVTGPHGKGILGSHATDFEQTCWDT